MRQSIPGAMRRVKSSKRMSPSSATASSDTTLASSTASATAVKGKAQGKQTCGCSQGRHAVVNFVVSIAATMGLAGVAPRAASTVQGTKGVFRDALRESTPPKNHVSAHVCACLCVWGLVDVGVDLRLEGSPQPEVFANCLFPRFVRQPP